MKRYHTICGGYGLHLNRKETDWVIAVCMPGSVVYVTGPEKVWRGTALNLWG